MFKHATVPDRARGILVEYVSEIRNTSGKPQFCVSVSSCGTSLVQHQLPSAAWKVVGKNNQSKGAPTNGVEMGGGVKITMRRLVRCQAVLNWLA
jgi:hypothetical protein